MLLMIVRTLPYRDETAKKLVTWYPNAAHELQTDYIAHMHSTRAPLLPSCISVDIGSDTLTFEYNCIRAS
jgi:hypothetical protein